jgi:putative PIN family toxin of toxin-antitoxin system
VKNNSLRIVIDANVIISSLVFGGKPEKFIKTIIAEKINVYTSPQLVSEILDVLRKKFHFSEEKIEKLERDILEISRIVYPVKKILAVRDIADNKVLEAAVEGKCSVIVTGDKDLLSLKKYKNIQILTASEFLDLML